MHTQTVASDEAVRRTTFRQLLSNSLGACQRLIETAEVWRDRSRQRRQLASLSSSQLKDLGISRTDVWQEVNKPFWQP